MPLYQMIYFSIKNTNCPQDLDDIIEASKRNNGRDQLTGCLFMHDRYFFQIVEGRRPVLSRLLERLYKDPRHRDLTVASFSGIDNRAFEQWEMHLLDCENVGVRNTYDLYTSNTLDPTQMSGDEIWDMLETMAQAFHETKTA